MNIIKYVILSPNKEKYTFQYMNSENCIVENVYKKLNKGILYKIIRKLIYFLGLKLNYIFYGDWIKYLDDESVKIIVFDACRPYHRLANILKKHKNTVIYFWNPISISKNKINHLKKYFSIYSYSKIESEKYELGYNPQFLPKLEIKQNVVLYDIFFCGKDKGRNDCLIKIASYFSNPYIYILSKEKKVVDKIIYSTKYMNYDVYLDNVLKSKILLEVLPCSTAGMTLRAIEAVFYKKKLITNNVNIKDERIYNENNILIIDDNTTSKDIENFIKRPFLDVNDDDCDYYEFSNWIKRF